MRQVHFVAFLQAQNCTTLPASWRHPDARTDTYSPEYTRLTGHMNLLGFPAISVPVGLVDGMPVGMQLVARPDEDATLMRAAEAYLKSFPQKHSAFG